MVLIAVLLVCTVGGYLLGQFLYERTRGGQTDADTPAPSEIAREVEVLSQALASKGVSHVLPQNMGGVEATLSLLREVGIPLAGPEFEEEMLAILVLTDEQVVETASYLDVVYERDKLRLAYTGG